MSSLRNRHSWCRTRPHSSAWAVTEAKSLQHGGEAARRLEPPAAVDLSQQRELAPGSSFMIIDDS